MNFLDKSFKQTDQEETSLRLKKSKFKWAKDISKTLDEQLKQNIKIAKGEMNTLDKLKLQWSWRKQEKGIQDITKKIEEARSKGLTGHVKKLETFKGVLETNLKNQQDYTDISKEGSKVQDELTSSIEGAIPGFSSLKAQAQKFTKALAANPMAAIALAAVALLALMGKMIKAAFELQKEFGLSLSNTIGLQTTLLKSSTALKAFGVTAEEVKSIASALLTEFGEIENVTEHTLNTIGKMSGQLGIAGADAVKLLGAMEGVSSQSRDALLSQIESVGKLARAEHVAPAKVMADMAANSELISLYASDNVDNLSKAAAQAAKLGINLGVVSKMAESLLDFESSIEATMEASMMIGRQINTDKARQLLMAGDMAGMQEEVMKQLGTEAEFNQMNVLQRQALAKAFGLSTGELSKMVRDQEELNNKTDEELAMRDKQAELSKQTTKAMESAWKSVQEAFQPVIQHMQEVFLTWMPLIGPLFKFIGATMKVAFLPLRLAFAILKPIIQLLGFLLKPIIDFGAALVDYVVVPFQGLMSIIEWIVNKVSALGGLFTGIFGGGGTTVNTTGTVSAAEGGTFTAPTNVNVADAGKPETVIPLDPAGIKVNNEDLLEKMDQLISAMGGVKNEVREMGVK